MEQEEIIIKEKVVAGLEGKTRQQLLYDEFCEAQQTFLESLQELKNWDDPCDCEEPNYAVTIAEEFEQDEEDYIAVKYCLNCGGHDAEGI